MENKMSGNIVKHGSKWYVRWYTGKWVINSKGNNNRERRIEFVCDYSDQYRTSASVERHPRLAEILRPTTDATPDSGVTGTSSNLTFKEYVENTYLPFVKEKKKPSTYKGYKNLFSGVIAPVVNGSTLSSFDDTGTSQRILDTLAESDPAENTLKHVKSFISGVITHAITYNREKMPGLKYNPLHRKLVNANGGHKSNPEDTYAHSLDEVEDMLEAVKDNQMYRTLIAVAMYSGLRRAEIRGLQWQDFEFDPKTLWGTVTVRRAYWGASEDTVKTSASKSVVPMIPQLTKELEAYRKQRGVFTRPDSFIFEGPRPNMPYDISAIGNKMMKPIFTAAELKDEDGNDLWHGWHSYRRGLGNELDSLEVTTITIASILRHQGPVSSQVVTEKHYMKKVKMPLMVKAMQKFSDEIVRVRTVRAKKAGRKVSR